MAIDFSAVTITGDEAVLVFMAVFWASAFGPLSAYRLFDTHAIWDATERRWAVRRLGAGTLFVNALPIGLALLMLGFLAGRHGVGAVFAAAVGALSLTGVRRIVHAAVATNPVKHWFYSPQTRNPWDERLPGAQNGFWRHFTPGVCYMALALVPWIMSGHLPTGA
jgi:hypothetical protein